MGHRVTMQAITVLLFILSKVQVQTEESLSTTEGDNLCADVVGCNCHENRYNKKVDGNLLYMHCKETTDPPLYLMPHEKIGQIVFMETSFTNISLLHEVRKTKIYKISLHSNIFKNGTIFNWDWLPDSTGNISLWKNGFQTFGCGNTVAPEDCDLNRFRPNFTLYLNQEKFNKLPQLIPTTTTTLVLQNLPSLMVKDESQNYSWAPSLQILKLSDGSFGIIPPSMFENAPQTLKTLWINKQGLQNGRWPQGLPAQSITMLLLTKCGISIIPFDEMEVFRRIDKLKHLWLSNNEVGEVPKNLPSSLLTLDVHHNRIQQVDPGVWSSTPRLTRLDISNNLLQSVPLKMPSTLVDLLLAHNLIGYCDPTAFSNLKNLTSLDLSNNRLTELPTGIRPGILSYMLNSNHLSVVNAPNQYTFCSQCVTMWLFDNPWYCNVALMKMVAWLSLRNVSSIALQYDNEWGEVRCQQLPIQGLEKNWVSVVMDLLEYYEKPPNEKCRYEINYLVCDNAGLLEIPKRIPLGLRMIQIVNDPNITTIPDYAFQNQTHLKRLRLYNNSLIHIPYGLPRQLVVLDLGENKIQFLSKKDSMALVNMTLLEQLFLNSNQLTVVHAWQLKPLTSLTWIGLQGNFLNCSCDLLSFMLWYHGLASRWTSPARNYAQCYTPEDVRNRYITMMMGYVTYELRCAPFSCDWNSWSTTINCSSYREPYKWMEISYGKPPLISPNSYWTDLDLTGLDLASDQVDYRHLLYIKNFILAENLLTSIPVEGLPPQIEMLDLSGNQIQYFPSHNDFMKHLPSLKFLDLQKNRIKQINKNVLGIVALLDSVLLKENPFTCNCSMRPLGSWIHANKNNTRLLTSHQLDELQCRKDGTKNEVRIMDVEEEFYCPPLNLAAIIAGCASVLGLVIVALIAFNVLQQKKQKKHVKEEILLGFQDLLAKEVESSGLDPETGVNKETNLKFDAFVSYETEGQDSEFVLTLLEEMEDKRGYKLCLNERDFIAGAGITDNIVECIGASRRIILVLSKSFVSSPWCQYEVQVALAELHERRRSEFLIALLLDDIVSDEGLAEGVKILLSLVPGIKVPAYTTDHGDEESWKAMWGKLIDAMPPLTTSPLTVDEALPLLR